MEIEPLKILLRFDRWATDRIIESCRKLTDSELDRQFPIGIGSLRATLAHIAGGMDWWIDHCEQRSLREYDTRVGSLDEIYARFVGAWTELDTILSVSNQVRLDEIIVDSFDNPEFGKGTLRFRRSAVLLHIFNHGTHHRVQCLNIFRQLGMTSIPDIDLIDSHQELER